MHLIIKDKYLKKIKNFLSIPCDSLVDKLKNVYIKVYKDKVGFYISNSFSTFKIELEKSESLQIIKVGKVTIDLKLFNSLLGKIKEANHLEIYKAEDNYLQFFSGEFVCNLISLSDTKMEVEEFDLSGYNLVKFPYSIFKSSYSRTKDFCKSSEDNFSKSAVLTNIHFEFIKDLEILEVWSSDAYRTIFGQFKFAANIDFSLDIHPSLLNILLIIFSEYSSEEIDVFFDSDVFIFKKNELFMKVRVFSDTYPKFINWFKSDKNIEFSISKSVLLDALERNLLLVNKNVNTTTYKLDEDKLFLEYKDEKGFCKESIEVKNLSGKNIDFSLNNSLLKPLVKNINSDEIIFSISDSLKPIILLPSEETENFKQFIVPVRNA